ncbi:hypothetical protein GCM10009560_72440 [Nonomuraea longicatena]|uniref:Uncharacterized protein n=1 Tax=Nonomuraea longicatena TaxID=83682 RepID=A0ABN1R5Q1_9ACTN
MTHPGVWTRQASTDFFRRYGSSAPGRMAACAHVCGRHDSGGVKVAYLSFRFRPGIKAAGGGAPVVVEDGNLPDVSETAVGK